MPEFAEKSWLTWCTAAVRNAETSRQREIAPSHVVITLVKCAAVEAAPFKNSKNKPKRTAKMFPHVLCRSAVMPT